MTNVKQINRQNQVFKTERLKEPNVTSDPYVSKAWRTPDLYFIKTSLGVYIQLVNHQKTSEVHSNTKSTLLSHISYQLR